MLMRNVLDNALNNTFWFGFNKATLSPVDQCCEKHITSIKISLLYYCLIFHSYPILFQPSKGREMKNDVDSGWVTLAIIKVGLVSFLLNSTKELVVYMSSSIIKQVVISSSSIVVLVARGYMRNSVNNIY